MKSKGKSTVKNVILIVKPVFYKIINNYVYPVQTVPINLHFVTKLQ